MITFVIIGNDIEKTYEYSPDVNIYKLKLDIIKDFELSCGYVDLNITIERPIRVLGKFNMEPGVLPRTMDMYPFDRYGIDNKIVTATFNEVVDYKPYDKKKNDIPLLKRALQRDEGKKEENIVYNLESEEDFPSLGG